MSYIALIEGVVELSSEKYTILKCKNGLGYYIHTSQECPLGSLQKFFITHIQRENSQDLYGFRSMEEKSFFDLILKVKGVGPKSAYSLVSYLRVNEIIQAIQFEDTKTLSRAPGIGKKAAHQIVLDLKDKKELNLLNLRDQVADSSLMSSESNLLFEVVQACEELGFQSHKVRPIITGILSKEKINNSEKLLAMVLKRM